MLRISLSIYSFCFFLGLLLYAPMAAWQRIVKGKQTVIVPRLRTDRSLDRSFPQSRKLRAWVHAVSVGEVNAIRPLVAELNSRGVQVVLSTTTATGHLVAKEVFADRVQLIYFPLDFGWICSRFLRAVRPDLILLVETEIWPNFISRAARMRIPTLLVNGRISDRSFGNYTRFRFFLQPILRKVSHFCVRTKQDKERFLALGADPEKINWVGNLKYDYQLPPAAQVETLKGRIRSALGLAPDGQLLLCGSTKPGEEELLLGAMAHLRELFPRLKMLLAPRHPHRAREVEDLAGRLGWKTVLRSQLKDQPEDRASDILILDTVGELAHLYEIADVVFMGGSLVPTGGQNIIEPAWFGKPILFGPSMENFPEIAQTFIERYAAIQVSDVTELQSRVTDLLGDAHACEWLARNARKVVRENQGAVERTMEIIEGYLKPREQNG